jgi:hypothetical protein
LICLNFVEYSEYLISNIYDEISNFYYIIIVVKGEGGIKMNLYMVCLKCDPDICVVVNAQDEDSAKLKGWNIIRANGFKCDSSSVEVWCLNTSVPDEEEYIVIPFAS